MAWSSNSLILKVRKSRSRSVAVVIDLELLDEIGDQLDGYDDVHSLAS